VIITGKIDLRGPAVLDMKEAASSLGTTRDSLYDLVGRGGIPCRRIGRKFIFPKADLDAWLQQLPGISVPQAIASIPLERRELWVKASVRIRYEESPVPQEYTPLTRGPKGHNRERLKAEPSA
jgi:excisionase family DNA binding protein